MGLFGNDEDRARRETERAEQERLLAEQQRAKTEARAREAWAASPLGQATAALEAGRTFLELQLEVGRAEGQAMWGTRDYASTEQITSSAELLGDVERLGWHLEHVGYVFRMTGQSSSEKMFLSGQESAVSGVTMGIYLFRAVRSGADDGSTIATQPPIR
ncbi:hypothetical protein FNH13_16850 [Ornithinimicrobium ciconiae]|uniref:Uncharacterized protein n=1 Tax=Ornithinimicrobium ciconiae TaxID=2594265 RepID=A0A516GE37_9MICO|nr:hypothetical protein [Ornithinimicrobium ciconiae]QDO89797.1 hypothetical protein FNH13_16850 [Ornithinimicrobium ciconiae]